MITYAQNNAELEALIQDLDQASYREVYIKDNEEMKRDTQHTAVYNTTANSIADIVSNRYTILQHKDAFMPVAETLAKIDLPYKATITNQRNRAYLDITFQHETIKPKDGETIFMGLRFKNSYDRSTNFSGIGLGMRLVCSNGMIGIGEIGSPILVKHIGKKILVQKPKIYDLVKSIFNSKATIEDGINQAMQKFFQYEEMENWIKENITKAEKNTKKIMERVDGKNSYYDLYNAITEYSSHEIENESTKEKYQMKAVELIRAK